MTSLTPSSPSLYSCRLFSAVDPVLLKYRLPFVYCTTYSTVHVAYLCSSIVSVLEGAELGGTIVNASVASKHHDTEYSTVYKLGRMVMIPFCQILVFQISNIAIGNLFAHLQEQNAKKMA